MRVLGTNIENIETNTKLASDGQSHFELDMELSVPRHTPVVMLKQYVDSLANELAINCDVNPM
jgi:glycine cleavage system regulatory protein